MTEELDKIARDLAAQGITVSVTQAPGAAFEAPRPSQFIAEAAKRAGIYYDDKETNDHD